MEEAFNHDGLSFDIVTSIDTLEITAQAFLNGKPVAAKFSASLEVASDYRDIHKESIRKELVCLAKGEVMSGRYDKGE